MELDRSGQRKPLAGKGLLGGVPVELVRGRASVALRFRQLQERARREVLVLDRPPYLLEPARPRDPGVRFRAIYDRAAPGSLPPHGEARLLGGVPTQLVIVDRRVALAPHQHFGQDTTAVLLRSPALLDGLITLFETLWEQACPPDPVAGKDQQLLTLLAAGLTDQAIARRLGVALRTVERRVRRLMDELGARTRFQAGLRAAGRTDDSAG